MVTEGTLGKYKLRAVEPESRRPLVETFSTAEAVAARRAALEQAGYRVLVTLTEGEIVQLERRRVFLDGGAQNGAQTGLST